MYSVVLMAALTTGIDMPDRGGRRGGGCCGCYGGGYGMGYGGCYGMGMGMGGGGCYGMGMGYGGSRMGYGGGWGSGYGMGYGGGWGSGYGMGYGGGYGYGGYTLTGNWPNIGGYANGAMMSGWGWNSPGTLGGAYLNSGTTQSFYYNSGLNNSAAANEATIVVRMPASASLSIDGQQTQQRSNTRIFTSPPLQSGKTYTYTLRAEMDRGGRLVRDTKTVEVSAGKRSEVTFNFDNANRGEEDVRPPAASDDEKPVQSPTPRRPIDR